jgi:Ankyrin repeat
MMYVMGMSLTLQCMQDGCTPLWVAAAADQSDIVKLLLKAPGIDVSAVGKVIASGPWTKS